MIAVVHSGFFSWFLFSKISLGVPAKYQRTGNFDEFFFSWIKNRGNDSPCILVTSAQWCNQSELQNFLRENFRQKCHWFQICLCLKMWCRLNVQKTDQWQLLPSFGTQSQGAHLGFLHTHHRSPCRVVPPPFLPKNALLHWRSSAAASSAAQPVSAYSH